VSAVVERTAIPAPNVEREIAERRLWTIADLAALPEDLPTGHALYELWDGELVLMAPPGDLHGSVEARLITVLTVHGEWEGHGRVSGGEVGVVMSVAPDTVFGVDAVFLTRDQLPARHSPEGYLVTIPALVAEVLSKNDTRPKVAARVDRYLAAGVRLVWIADRKRRTVTAYRPGEAAVVLGEDDVLTAEGIIPGLAFPIRRLFQDLDE
jgi:Uma2 family endonuclease